MRGQLAVRCKRGPPLVSSLVVVERHGLRVGTYRQGVPRLPWVFDWLEVAPFKVAILKRVDVTCGQEEETACPLLFLVEKDHAVLGHIDAEPGGQRVHRSGPGSGLTQHDALRLGAPRQIALGAHSHSECPPAGRRLYLDGARCGRCQRSPQVRQVRPRTLHDLDGFETVAQVDRATRHHGRTHVAIEGKPRHLRAVAMPNVKAPRGIAGMAVIRLE